MRVYLVRHGDANPGDVDPARGLSAKGLRDVQKMAAFLKPFAIQVAAVWQSGKTRAAQTAEILARAVTSREGVTVREGLAPNDAIGPVRESLNTGTDDVMVVGHLPFLGKLASSLVADDKGADVVAFHAGAVVCLERDDDGDWYVVWMMNPQTLP